MKRQRPVDPANWFEVANMTEEQAEEIRKRFAKLPPTKRPWDAEADIDPGGYENLGRDIGKLVAEKQAAYGDSFGHSGQVMRILYRDGIPADKLDDALTVVRVVDKLFRIATDRDALGESPWRDIAGYALLASKRAEDNH